MRLAGKAAIVTGGAMGMGRAIALRLAAEGAWVTVLDIDAAAANETVRLAHGLGGDVHFQPCDVASDAAVRRAMEAHCERFGGLDILVNNVGVMHRDDDLVEAISDAAWDWTLGINVKGPYNCAAQAIPHMIAAGGGSIVTTSSNAGVMGAGRPAYGASKGAVIAMMLAFARQYADAGIRSNVILPGAFRTPMLDVVMDYPMSAKHPTYRPLVRIAEPEEITGAVAYLASDDARGVTGMVLPVDGGSTAV
jgi:NAD(P)-dependent dehydrogenase (short-subunit alcohol dehydrogenase family)